jgi:hypothetical protein
MRKVPEVLLAIVLSGDQAVVRVAGELDPLSEQDQALASGSCLRDLLVRGQVRLARLLRLP